MLRNYLKISYRNLVRNKVFSAINIIGLAAGLSCCMLICGYIYDELSYDTHHPNVAQLYQVGTVFVTPDGENKTPNMPHPLADALQQEYPEIANTTPWLGKLWRRWRRTWNVPGKLNPNEPFEYSFLDEEFQKNYVAETRLATVVGYFTAIAILISCLGLFGLASFNVEQRVKEIGIRKVLGATVGSVLLPLSKDFLKLVLRAVVIASPLAWYVMNRWLQNFAYKTQIGWAVFGITTLATLGITLFTISFQSIRAALMNPVKSLRSE